MAQNSPDSRKFVTVEVEVPTVVVAVSIQLFQIKIQIKILRILTGQPRCSFCY
jgi:hypothetical protein